MSIKLSSDKMIKRLEPPSGKIKVVLDTDTYNEVDDQFAVAYAMKSLEKVGCSSDICCTFFK